MTRRLEQYLVDSGCGIEAVRAVLAERGDDPAFAAETARELDAVVKAKGSDALKTAMAVLARPTKLVRGKELPEDLEVRRDALVDAEEVALYDAYLAAREALGDGSASSVSTWLAAAATLSAPPGGVLRQGVRDGGGSRAAAQPPRARERGGEPADGDRRLRRAPPPDRGGTRVSIWVLNEYDGSGRYTRVLSLST